MAEWKWGSLSMECVLDTIHGKMSKITDKPELTLKKNFVENVLIIRERAPPI